MHILQFYTTTSVCSLALSSHADFYGYGDRINSHSCGCKEWVPWVDPCNLSFCPFTWCGTAGMQGGRADQFVSLQFAPYSLSSLVKVTMTIIMRELDIFSNDFLAPQKAKRYATRAKTGKAFSWSKSVSLLCLTETYMCTCSSIPVPSFDCCCQGQL